MGVVQERMIKFNILSLFDGMSCGQLALNIAGIPINNYYASEINPYAIKVTQSNFPNTIQLGNVQKIESDTLPSIDILIGGSPCQGFSIAGRKLNFEDDRSKLFFEFVRLLNEVNPKYFLFENVRMPDNVADLIDELLGVQRVFINSYDFTGHIRKRYYWTNIPIAPWEKKTRNISDIIEDYPFNRDANEILNRTVYQPTTSSDGIITINPRDNKGKQTWQRGRIYDISGNCPTICASLYDLNITDDHKTYRKLSISECEKLQGVPVGYTQVVPKSKAGEMLGNGWTVDVISHIFSSIQ